MLARFVSISWPHDLLVSASQSAGITGLSHHAQLKNIYFIILNENLLQIPKVVKFIYLNKFVKYRNVLERRKSIRVHGIRVAL